MSMNIWTSFEGKFPLVFSYYYIVPVHVNFVF